MAGGPAPSGGGGMFSAGSQKAFNAQLKKVYTWYTGGFLVFIVVLAILEQLGLPRNWIGYVFLLATVLLTVFPEIALYLPGKMK
jgi:cation/acetate symporter